MGIIKNLSQEEVKGIKLEVNELVNNLLITYLELPNGNLQKLEGEFVEPIHLKWFVESGGKKEHKKKLLRKAN